MKKISSFRAAIAVLGTIGAISTSNAAHALSIGCGIFENGRSSTLQSVGGDIQYQVSNLSLEANEVFTFTWTSTNTNSRSTHLEIGGTPIAAGTKTLGSPGQTPVSFSYTFPTSGNYTIVTKVDGNGDSVIGDFTLNISCALASAGGGGESSQEEPSQETTSKAVTSAVSRSQTTVIQQNIGARVATVIGSAGAGTTGAGGEAGDVGSVGSGSTPTGNDDSNSFRQASLSDQLRAYSNSEDDTRDVMRRLAMTSSFDSSALAADMARESALALGPTDEGTVGGASGVDGRAALASASPITVWGHGSYTSVDNDYNDGTSDNRYDGDVWGYNLGADYRFANNVIAGLSLGYNDTDLTTTFNDGTYKETAWVASPYVIFSPVENLNIVGEAGYSQGDIDVTRDNDSVSGATDSAMFYASIKGVYAYRPLEDTPLTLSPSVSLLAARKTIDSYTESDGTFVDSSRSNTRQIKPAIEAAYDFGFNTLTVTPFIETGMIHDFTDELNNDKTAFNLGGGVRLSDAATGFNAALEGSYLAGRDDYTEYTIAGTVSYGFELRDLDGQPVGLMTPFFGSDVDEYGNQSVAGGLGFSAGPMQSRLSLAHDVSQSGNAESQAEITMSLDF